MPVRPRQPADLPACVASLRRVHKASGYPSRWPDDPGAWITPRSMVAAWVAEHNGEVAGHVALVRGLNVECLLRATGLPLEALGGIVRLYVDPGFQRLGLARALLDTVTAAAVDHGLRPVLDVVDDSAPAIALYEQAGWKLAGIQPATWTDPNGSIPLIRCYIGPEGTSAPRPGSANPGNHYLSPPSLR